MNLNQEFKDFIRMHEADDIRKLALQSARFPYINMQDAIRQIQGRKIAKEKVPFWYSSEDIIYPKHISLEQSSSEHTALYKIGLAKGISIVDLTGGMGVDISFFARNFDHAVYVERQTELVDLAAHNFKALDLPNIAVVNKDAVDYLQSMPVADLIYIDPARRDNVGNKTVRIEDCTPNILEIEQLLEDKGVRIMIKLSPMLDISLATRSLKNISEVHIVSVNNECKELLFIKDKMTAGDPTYHCVNIRKNNTDIFSYKRQEEESVEIPYTANVGKYLYEPNSSLIKAGAYKIVAQKYDIKKLHPNSHLYTSDAYSKDFQGRKFVVQGVCTLNKKDIKDHLSVVKNANITVRNFPLSPPDVRKRLKIAEGGDTYIFATTLADEKKVLIICRKSD